MSDVQKVFERALQEGHSLEDVLNDFGSSKDPEEKSFAENYRKNLQGAKSSDRMNQFVTSGEAEQTKEMSDFSQQLSGGFSLPSWMKTPEGLLTSGLAAKGGFEVGKAVGKATMPLISRMFSKEPTSTLPKTFSQPNKVGPITDVIATPTEYEKALGPNWQEMLDRSEAARKEKQAIAQQNARQSMTKPGTIPTQNAPMGMAPPAPPAPPAPVSAAPASPLGIPEVPTVAQLGQQALGQAPVAPPQTVAQVASETTAPKTLTTGTGREVVEGQGPLKKKFAKEYASVKDVPKGYVFLPGGQYIDVLRNDLGQSTYTEQFTKRGFPPTYPESVQAGKDINRELNRPTREQLKASGQPMPEGTAGILKKVGENKIVKVGGTLGALLSVADIAKAQDANERKAIASETGLDLASGAILAKLLGGPAAIAASAALGSSGLNKHEEEQLQRFREQEKKMGLLGSPYGTSPWAIQQRKNKSLGVVPPQ